MVAALLFAMGLAAAPQVEAPKNRRRQPAQVAEIDAGKLKGTLVRMAWRLMPPQLYLQTAEPDTRGNVKLRHYTMGLDGQGPEEHRRRTGLGDGLLGLEVVAGRSRDASWRIAIDQQQKRVSATSNPAGGDLAKGATEGAAPAPRGVRRRRRRHDDG